MRRWASQYGSYTPSTDVPNLANWWRADTVTTVSGAVSSLNDKKGSVNLAQGAAGKRPVYNAADSLMGGRDSITFDGIDDVLTAASPGVGAMNAITVYLVIRSMTATAAVQYILATGTTATDKSVQLRMETTGSISSVYRNPAASVSTRTISSGVAGHNAAASVPLILSSAGTTANGGSTVWATTARLGNLSATATNNSTGSTIVAGDFALGASNTTSTLPAAFTFAELMICSAAHTAEQMLAVNMYLAGYYGVLN